MSDLTPQQRTVCVELLSRATALNSYAEADIILDQLTALIHSGQNASRIIRWLNLLPRALNLDIPQPDPAQLTLLTPVADLPEPVKRAMQPSQITRTGSFVSGNPAWLVDPDNAPAKLKRRGRPRVGVCAVCNETFPMNPVGRPASKCPDHRRSQRKDIAS